MLTGRFAMANCIGFTHSWHTASTIVDALHSWFAWEKLFIPFVACNTCLSTSPEAHRLKHIASSASHHAHRRSFTRNQPGISSHSVHSCLQAALRRRCCRSRRSDPIFNHASDEIVNSRI